MDNMIVVYSPGINTFKSPGQIHFGERGPSPEVPERSRQIAFAIQTSGLGTLVEPKTVGIGDIEAIHARGYLDYLQTANQQPIIDPESNGLPAQVLFPAAFPYTDLWPVQSTSVMAAAGVYCFDTYTPLTSEVWPAALLSAECAWSAADLLLRGEKVSMAVCRPPGHHAMRSKCGGFCYLNNAAIATQHLTQAGKVAILDLDYHHGNGTQEIFYTSSQVLYVSLHADPAEAYPYFSGYAEEIGSGQGLGCNLNIPLPPGTDDTSYDLALETAMRKIREFSPKSLVISLGFDICINDPLTTFKIQPKFFNTMARRIARLELPTVIITEGGYAVSTLGDLAVRFVQGWSERQ
jgi:acetoin utilization deacetylase AcuC-like enzyme